jgi:DNA-binding SARP family transcriptional activator
MTDSPRAWPRPSGGVSFGLLGPVEAWRGAEPLALGGPRRRAVLALLLLRANQVVSLDRLADDLYAGEPPSSAATQIHGHVSALRRTLAADAGMLATRPPGYVLRVAAGELDLTLFEQELARAERARSANDDAEVVAALRAAEGLWRGGALGDLADEPFAAAAIGRLEEMRIAATEERIAAELRLGHEPVSELGELVRRHPLRERLRELQMLALYRSGRQAEALAAFRSARAELVDGFGLEPSAALHDLERAILRQDPALAPERRTPPAPATGCVLGVAFAAAGVEAVLGVLEPLAAGGRRLVMLRPLGEAGAVEQASRELNAVRARLRAAGVDGRVAAFASAAAGADVARLAEAHDPELIAVDAPAGLLLDGMADAELAELLERAVADVAIVVPRAEPPRGLHVVAPFSGSDDDWSAIQLAAWLADARGTTLVLAGARERADGKDASRMLAAAALAVQGVCGVATQPLLIEASAAGLVAAAAGAALVVTGVSARWRQEGLGPARLRLARDAEATVILVRRGVRPAGLAPAGALTRFTWSLGSG